MPREVRRPPERPRTRFRLPAARSVRFDALLVDQLRLADVAAHVQSVAAADGLAPPAYFGTEVVARYLGLRYDHPAGTDHLELFPTDQTTRAEAARSLAQGASRGGW